jgi:hypothetical protein
MRILRRLYARFGEIVAVLEAPRNEGNRFRAELSQHARENRRRADPVHVIIPVDHHRLARFNCLNEAFDRLVRPLHEKRVVEVIESRPEKAHRFLRVTVLSNYQEVRNFLRYLKRLGELRHGVWIRLPREDPSCRRPVHTGGWNFRDCRAHSRNLNSVNTGLKRCSPDKAVPRMLRIRRSARSPQDDYGAASGSRCHSSHTILLAVDKAPVCGAS